MTFKHLLRYLVLFTLVLTYVLASAASADHHKPPTLKSIPNAKKHNIVFILADDHRYDAMGFLNHPFLKTPEMDRMAKDGAYFKNAFVTTSLCSPSRASILTGLFMHNHGVMDNNTLAKKGSVFFPLYLQKAGYKTAFVGKWHMGGASDAPRLGFDHWVSFRGQGRYYPRANWTLNVNGKRIPQKGYITDELTDYAVSWLNTLKKDQPFFLYLSHKAVHAEFAPAKRHAKLYADARIPTPVTQANTPQNYRNKPKWVKDQRNSWHGVDFPYHSSLNVKEYFRKYCQTLAAVDESIGRVRQWLKRNNHDQDTLIIYMGDNGFLFGEHGLIDKRNAYEESMRVPMLGIFPKHFKPGTIVEGIVANIDIAATCLEAAGLQSPGYMDGQSFIKLGSGKTKLENWRKSLMYEYYWEWNFPHTPTTFALRTNDYKFITYHGVWDLDELYDMKMDTKEQRNLAYDPKYRQIVRKMRTELYTKLKAANADRVPFSPKRRDGAVLRRKSGSKPSTFPPFWLRNKDGRN